MGDIINRENDIMIITAFRIKEETKDKLIALAKLESEKSGYTIRFADLVRKSINELLERLDKGN